MPSIYRLIPMWIMLCSLLHSHAQGSGNLLEFDGSTESVNLGNQVVNNTRTIEFWCMPSSFIDGNIPEPYGVVVRKDTNNADEITMIFMPNSWGNGGRLSCGRRIGSTSYDVYSDNNSWEANRWYHFAFTIDPVSGMKLYVNGILQQSTDPSTDPFVSRSSTSQDDIYLGKWGQSTVTRYYKGRMDEVRIWEDARSQSEVREFMCKRLTGNEQGLRAYYDFDGTSITTLADRSPNNFNGLINNMDPSNRQVSSAPIGEESLHLYQPNLNGKTIQYLETNSDFFQINGFVTNAEGVHIYKVNQDPNYFSSLPATHKEFYYGVFFTDTGTKYDVQYHMQSDCSDCNVLYTRNDNADTNWQILPTSFGSCTHYVQNESQVKDNYRAEYNISTFADLANLGPDKTICSGDSILLSVSQEPTLTYKWTNGSTSSSIYVKSTGQHGVTVSNSSCETIDFIEIGVITAPLVNLPEELMLCEGELGKEVTAFYPNSSYLWHTGGTSKEIVISEIGEGWVQVTNQCGQVSDTFQINSEICGCRLFTPNTIIPNSTFGNNIFKPTAKECDFTEYVLRVFNRWGEPIFETKDFNIPWNGKYSNGNFVPMGVYLYSIRYASGTGRLFNYNGNVTVVY